MVRALLRLILVLVIVVAAAAFFLGRHDSLRGQQVGAEVGQKAAEAANKAADYTTAVLSDSALTAKIKSKMALDDTVHARAIDVSTTGHVVTVSGIVGSQAEHDRVVQLAGETTGVTRVVDHLAFAR
jgi:hyperosmotically inducible protein